MFEYLSQEWVEEASSCLKEELTPEKMEFITSSILAVHTNCPDGKGRAIHFRMGNGVIERVSVMEGALPQAEFTITGDYETFARIFRAELNAGSALMSGELKVKGNLVKAMRLAPVVDRLNEVLVTIPTKYYGELGVGLESFSASPSTGLRTSSPYHHRSGRRKHLKRQLEALFSFSDIDVLQPDLELAVRVGLEGPSASPSTGLRTSSLHHRGSDGSTELAEVGSAKSALEKDTTSDWQVVHDTPGRLRLRNPILYRRGQCCREIEKAVYNTIGVERAKANPTTTSVLIEYDAAETTKAQLIDSLEKALQALEDEDLKFDEPRLDRLAVSTLSLGVNAAAMVFPPLIPVGVGLTLYSTWPIFKKAFSAIRTQKVKVDVLDAALAASCLVYGQVFAAAFNVWILDLAKALLESGIELSKDSLKSVFSKKPRFVYVMTDGTEVLTPLDKVERGDIVVVSPGETIPIDGKVCEGLGMVDQHILTGESAPVEKGAGDEVLASTVLLAGKLHVEVEELGEQTIEGKIVKIINESANYKPKIQATGERIADQMVVPTLGLAGLGMITQGPSAFAAIINADYGTGIRIAAPTAVLAYIGKAARRGVVIKNGSVLETLTDVGVFVFDKTGTLTRTVPEVGEIICNEAFDRQKVLSYAAAAEQRLSHPIAKAILGKAKELRLELPERDESRYNVGLGIEVVVGGDEVRVGSARFMKRGEIIIPARIEERIENSQRQGKSMVLVAINDILAGAVELRSSNRPEAADAVQRLRQRGKEVILISGDHQKPTERFAQQMGIDHWYAEVLPQGKADIVRKVQAEGKKVAFVGDGVNDTLALSQADVSLSLGGASDIAKETADVIFMDGGLVKLDLLYDVSGQLQRTVDRSWKLILYPNSFCILGALAGLFGLGTSLVLNNAFIFLSMLNASLALGSGEDNGNGRK